MAATEVVAVVPPPPAHVCGTDCLKVNCIMIDPVNAKESALHAFSNVCPNGFEIFDATMGVRIQGKKSTFCTTSIYFKKINRPVYFKHDESKKDIKILTQNLPTNIEMVKGHTSLMDPYCYVLDFLIKCNCGHPFSPKTTTSAAKLAAKSVMVVVAVIEKFIESGWPFLRIDYEIIPSRQCGHFSQGSILVLPKQTTEAFERTSNAKKSSRETGEPYGKFYYQDF